MGKRGLSGNQCKCCKRSFDDPNPCVKNPSPGDTLKRRVPGALECRPCANMIKVTPKFNQMTKGAVLQWLEEDPGHQQEYDAALESWCELRREGKKNREQGHQRVGESRDV